ncbi:hypothetical protein KO02_09985 [Sphingobacterium sp. ML3W]|uniref:hypothetical protein n=1 Tax=Sphingobacterium sp. ML3W TaxID=1538644 RepID=UPI0004F6316A|nr:hypothetical protein [Sphingobacterium sp. ML3W]AIM36988.1 hypothetical protein KO02_09985 [Sphingobacterium sp. ML3W]
MRYLNYCKDCMYQLQKVDQKDALYMLNQLFKDADSAELIQEECWEVFALAFKPNLWKTYTSPLILYKKYKQLLHLLDLGSMITSLKPRQHTIGRQQEVSILNLVNSDAGAAVFKNEKIQQTYKTLSAAYADNMLQFYRMDLFQILLAGFDHKGQLNDTCLGEMLFLRFRAIREIVNCLFIIHLHEKVHWHFHSCVPQYRQTIGHKVERSYTTDHDIYGIIDGATTIPHMHEQLKVSHKIILESNYWKTHEDPGTVLVRFQYFRNIIETFYLHFMTISDADFNIDVDWPIPAKQQKALNKMAKEVVRNPWRYVEHKLKEKPLACWLKGVDEWEEAVLSNEASAPSFIQRIDVVKTFLATLIVIADLMVYEPLYELHDDVF